MTLEDLSAREFSLKAFQLDGCRRSLSINKTINSTKTVKLGWLYIIYQIILSFSFRWLIKVETSIRRSTTQNWLILSNSTPIFLIFLKMIKSSSYFHFIIFCLIYVCDFLISTLTVFPFISLTEARTWGWWKSRAALLTWTCFCPPDSRQGHLYSRINER